MSVSNSMIKQEARGLLAGRYGTFTGAFLVVLLATYVSGMLTDFISLSTGSVLMTLAAAAILMILRSLLQCGLSFLCLGEARGEQMRVNMMFSVFSVHPDTVILISLYLLFLSIVCLVPFLAAWVFAFTRLPAQAAAGTSSRLLLLAAALVSLILIFYVLSRYSQVFFLFFDKPNRRPSDLLRESSGLMRGKLLRWLRLQLSFIGLVLLSLLTLGVGFLWVAPYIRMSNALFYLYLRGGEPASDEAGEHTADETGEPEPDEKAPWEE